MEEMQELMEEVELISYLMTIDFDIKSIIALLVGLHIVLTTSTALIGFSIKKFMQLMKG